MTSENEATRSEINQSANSERAVYRRAGRNVALALPVLAVLGALGGWLIAGRAGLLGAAVGFGIAVLFALPTPFSGAAATHLPPTTGVALLVGTFIAKMVILFIVLALLRGQDWYHRGVLFTMVLLGWLLGAVTLTHAVLKGRMPYAQPPEQHRSTD